jgi:hypothetical protein
VGTFLHLNVALMYLCFLKLKTIKINDDVFFIFMYLIAFHCYVFKSILFMFLGCQSSVFSIIQLESWHKSCAKCQMSNIFFSPTIQLFFIKELFTVTSLHSLDLLYVRSSDSDQPSRSLSTH